MHFFKGATALRQEKQRGRTQKGTKRHTFRSLQTGSNTRNARIFKRCAPMYATRNAATELLRNLSANSLRVFSCAGKIKISIGAAPQSAISILSVTQKSLVNLYAFRFRNNSIAARIRYCRSIFAVAFIEPIDPPAGIDHFLFARKKRMAFRANFDFDRIALFGTARRKGFPASASDRYVVIIRMNIVFHVFFTVLFALISKATCILNYFPAFVK
jgi:hypothetical protein